MKRLLTLTAMFTLATATAQNGCSAHPTHALGGRVKIEYPKTAAPGAAYVKRVCTAEAQKVGKQIVADSKKNGITVSWVEVYDVYKWTSAFHGLMTKTRPLGFKQMSYKRQSVSRPNDSSFLVYADKNGKYIAMVERNLDAQRTQFIVYGN